MVFRDIYEALTHTVYGTGKAQKEIAAEFGVSPSELSRMCAHPDDDNRRYFDVYRVETLLRFTGDLSLLETWAAKLGYRLVREEEAEATGEIDDIIQVLQRARRLMVANGKNEKQPLTRRQTDGNTSLEVA